MVAVAYPALGLPKAGGRTTAPVGAARATVRPRVTPASYRRRRLGVGSLVLTMLLAGRVVVGSLGGGPLSAPEPTSPMLITRQVHVVQPGDTLWSIARSLQPEGDVRRLVHQLSAQRSGAALQVGERITLP